MKVRRLAPVLALFFLAPLVAEFFLGDFSILQLPLIVPLAPMYGGGAILIRELARRTARGWPTIAVLALAFGVFQEALLTQSLFNPNYAGAHLLEKGFLPALGIAIPWTVFVLALHTVWSISTPVAIVEECTGSRRTHPWLGVVGLIVTALLFTAGSVFTFAISYTTNGHFMASPAQLGISAAIVVGLVAIAFRLPHLTPRYPGAAVPAPAPWLVFTVAMVAGGLFMAGLALPTGMGVAVMLLGLAGIAAVTVWWSARPGWGHWHRYALASAAVLTYAWHAFFTQPVQGGGAALNLISHIIYAALGLGVLGFAAWRIRGAAAATTDQSGPTDTDQSGPTDTDQSRPTDTDGQTLGVSSLQNASMPADRKQSPAGSGGSTSVPRSR